MLSVIIPAYNEEKMIPKTAEAVGKVLQEAAIEYEIIFINDGSGDGTWDAIRACNAQDQRVRGGCLSRNFGKEAAMRAGLAMSRGDCAVIMDCDLQDPPEKIPEMYALWQQGYEIVAGVKHSRGKESAGYGLMTKLFYGAMSSALNTDMSRASDFKLLDRKAILVLLNIREQNIFFRAMSSWVGFKTTEIEFDVQERTEGTSKWSKWNLVKYAINNITSYTMLPLHVILLLGVIMFVLAIIFGVDSLASYFAGRAQNGFTTVILLQLIIGSMTMIALGIIGYYVARIFDEVRQRPQYILAETTDGEEPAER